jgi:hypothetical protein
VGDLKYGGIRSESNKPPEALAVRVEGVRLAIDGPLLQLADRQRRDAGAARTNAHCGNEGTNDFATLARLGYDALTFDGEIGYRVEKRARRVTVTTAFDAQDPARIGVRMVFRRERRPADSKRRTPK